MVQGQSESLDFFLPPPDRDSEAVEKIDLPDAEVLLFRNLFSKNEADALFEELRQEVSWKQEKINLYGKEYALPRLTAWYGEPNKTYIYSGITVEASPWIPVILKIKERIERVSASKVIFNSVLLNLYRDGSDGVSWHADDEPELGEDPVIGSVSLGEERSFQMKHKTDKNVENEQILLENGSYLLMQGPTQHHWLHQIPKSKRSMNERINLTFRNVA